MKPKIFISHSTTGPNLDLLERVCDSLEEEGFEVLADRNKLQPNDDWFKQIHAWLYECHAALILLSEDSLISKWVQIETAILGNRRWNEENFKLLIAPLEKVDASAINAHPILGDVARLQNIQFLPKFTDVNALLGNINAQLAVFKQGTSPFEELVGELRKILKGIDEEVLDEALEKLECEDMPTHANPRCRADVLARAVFRDPLLALANLRHLLESLACIISPDRAEKLLEIVKGIWVEGEAAAHLAQARRLNLPVAINCRELEDFTGPCYGLRAWPFPKPIVFIKAGGSRTFAQVEEAMIKRFLKSRTEARAKQTLKDYKYPILLMFPAPEDTQILDWGVDEQDLLDRLKTEYPRVTVVLGTGPRFPEHMTYATALFPPLSEKVEAAQSECYYEVFDYIDNKIKQV